MAVPFPQNGNAEFADKLFLDDGLAGQLVFSEYFQAGTDDLTATGVDAREPSVGSPAIGQVHALTATGVATAEPSVGGPVLSVWGGTETPSIIQPTGGNLNFLNPRRFRIVEDEDDREELRKEIVRIGKAAQPETITGIVQPRRRDRTPNIETVARTAQQRRLAEQARQEQIRRQIAADDEWLMLA